MKQSDTADVLIAGAGCAGLSLAVHMVQAGVTDRRIVLLDPRTAYGRDRTWCFWDTAGPTPFEDAVTHSWDRWRVVSEGGDEVVRGARRIPYRHLPADRFYEAARAILRDFSNVEVRLGCPVESVREEGKSVRVTTAGGVLHAGVVFDSRPCRPNGTPPARSGHARPALLQHFLGVRVRADRDVFDPATVTLMDFHVPQDAGIHFLYVLPFSRREALMEATFLSRERLRGKGDYQEALGRYCAARYPGTGFSVLGEEAGAIPMEAEGAGRVARRDPPSRVIPAGAVGGLTKPSTGYAFLAIQKWSAHVAGQMARGSEVPVAPAPRSRRAALMDRTFLGYLSAHPNEAPALFTRLFRNTAPESLVRFLSDAGSPWDDLAVIRALPKAAFLRQAAFEALRIGAAPRWAAAGSA